MTRRTRGDGIHGSCGGFEYVARERRRELFEEARNRHLVRLARPERGLRERLARVLRPVVGLWETVRVADAGHLAVGEVPDFACVTRDPSGGPGTAVEVNLSDRGCVVRKTDLGTGQSSLVAEGRIRQ